MLGVHVFFFFYFSFCCVEEHAILLMVAFELGIWCINNYQITRFDF